MKTDARTWLKRWLNRLFDKDGNQLPLYDERLNDFMGEIWELKPSDFKYADVVSTALYYQSTNEAYTKESLFTARTLCSLIDMVLLTHDVKPKLVEPSKLVNEYSLTRLKAYQIYESRALFIYALLTLYAHNAGIDALINILQMPELAAFKIKRVEPITENWEDLTLSDFDGFTISPSLAGAKFETFMNFFNTFFVWVNQQKEYKSLKTPAPIRTRGKAPIIREFGDDFTLEALQPFNYHAGRVTKETLNRITSDLLNKPEPNYVTHILDNHRLQLVESGIYSKRHVINTNCEEYFLNG